MIFYAVNNNLFDDKYFAYADGINKETGDFEKCSVCGSAISMRRWLPPLKIKLSKPKYGDFLFGSFSNFMCSEQFKIKYKKSDLKGIIEFESVEVVKVNRKKNTDPEPPEYFLSHIIRSKVRIDEKKSHFNWGQEPTCNNCRADGIINGVQGFSIDLDTWNNEDIFYAIGLPGTIIVSQKFHDFIINNKFTNIKLTKTEDYTWGTI